MTTSASAGTPAGSGPLLLDLDRTLVDVESHVDYCAALRELDQAGVDRGPELGPATSWGGCTRIVIDALLAVPDRDSWQRAGSVVVPYELAGAHRATPMPGLDTLRAALEGERYAIVTLLSDAATRIVLERHRLAPEVVVTRTYDVPAKPHPDQVLAATRALGVEPATALMVGDGERDEVAAIAAGVPFIGLTNGRDAHRFIGAATLRGLPEVARLIMARRTRG